jgi:hypothetical protein
MSQHAPKAPPIPDFVPTLAWAAALMVLMQLTGSTSWMLVPPGILALGAFVSWQRLPGVFFGSMPISLLFETTGSGIEDILYVLLMLGEVGPPQNRNGYVSLGIENLSSIVLWFALGLVWIGGFRELALRTMAKRDPFPGPSGRLGPCPHTRTLIPADMGRRHSVLGLALLGIGILMVMILQFSNLHPELSYYSILRVRFVTLAGGAFLVLLTVRAFTGYMHWRAMPQLEAGMVVQEGSWREGVREFTALNRWLSWARLSARMRGERQWKRLLSRRKQS